MKLFFSTIALLLLASMPALGFIEMSWPDNIDLNAKTNIIVAGSADKLGWSFQKTAYAQAKRYLDMDPQSQVIIFSAIETDLQTNVNKMNSWSLHGMVRTNNGSSFKTSQLINRLLQFQRIKSLTVIGHNAPHLGTALETKAERFSHNTPNLVLLKTHFENDAYIVLYGCNAGFRIGAELSKILQIPVQAALSSTNFQKLNVNNQYYGDDPGLAPNQNWKSHNNIGFTTDVICPGGECMRMKADNVPYGGFWGRYPLGLGFYKWFCTGATSQQCANAFVLGAKAWLGLSPAQGPWDQAQVHGFIADFFCPQDPTGKRYYSCMNSIEKALKDGTSTYSPFQGTTAQCDLKTCQVSLKCGGSSCTVASTSSAVATTYMDEIRLYLQAFQMTY